MQYTKRMYLLLGEREQGKRILNYQYLDASVCLSAAMKLYAWSGGRMLRWDCNSVNAI
jgi:hypothetical protein